MAKKKVIIIDDEQDARLLLRQYLTSCEAVDIIGECSNGIDAVMAIDTLEPDWVFLDVQMPGLNGFEVLQRITHIPRIIFSTAYDSFALEAFDHNAVDYLLKPYSLQRFSSAVRKLREGEVNNYISLQKLDGSLLSAESYPQRFLLRSGHKLVGVKIDDIIWFEAWKDYANTHTLEKSYLSDMGIGAIEKKLDPNVFIRIHRSAIVNVNYIKEAFRDNNGLHVTFINGKTHKVGRTYKGVIKRFLL